jgi:hypothetical protein
MGLANVFKLSIYALTGFVGLALGAAEQGVVPFISLPVTAFAYWWCEVGTRRGFFSRRGMGETTAVVLGFLALLAATIEMFSDNEEGKLLAGIHLVVYLTWIVLLQKKSIYRYWLLLALGMMHVAVGSVLTNATWYGLMMVAYLFGAIWTLSVFSLYRAAEEFTAVEPELVPSQPPVSSSTSTGQVFNAVRFEDHARWISMRLVSGVLLTASAGLLVGAVFFALIPRIWVGAALGISDESLPPAMRRNVTGQITEIRLGDMGPILSSNDPVLTLRIFDNATNRPIDSQKYAELLGTREPLFRGAILTEYRDGRWRPERSWSGGATSLLPAQPDDPTIKQIVPTVRQEIHLERIGSDVLPCLGRAVAMRDPEGYKCARMQTTGNLALRRDWFKNLPGAVDYVAYTPLPTSSTDYEDGLIASASEMVVYRMSNYIPRCAELPESLERLQSFSRQLVVEAEQKSGEPLTSVQKARLIESYLRDSGQFTYSLDARTVDPLSDPVEDFLFRRRAGHCQYFASALALMLRAVDVPTRLAGGFKGGEELSDGRLNVEKRFAHVWVEAWVDNRKWITVDATPEDGRTESVSAVGSKRNFFTTMTSRLAGIWESNVLDISYERQNDVIYQPLRDALAAVVQFGRDFWHSPQSSLMSILVFMVDPRNWLTIPGGIMLVTLAGLLWVLRRKAGWFRFTWKRKPVDSVDPEQHRVEFYERFIGLMTSQGLIRKPTQTQGEFVHEVADRLSSRWHDESLARNLASIGDLFYRVRFGAGELTEQEKSSLDAVLTGLERQLRPEEDRKTQPA